MPDPILPPVTRGAETTSRVAPLVVLGVTLAVAGCGSSTGDLPVGADASRGANPSSNAFADPVSSSGGTDVTATDTFDADVTGREPLPASGPAPAFADPVSASPFETPDPTAPTLVGRLGRAALVDLADTFAAARFVDDYLAVDDELLALVASGGVEVAPGQARFDCPEGGQARVGRNTATRDGVLAFALDGCALGGFTLSGSVVRTTTLDGFRSGASERLELDYRELVVDGGGARATTLTGTTRRDVTRRANADCGGEDVDLVLVHRIGTASVMRDGLTVQVTDARHDLARTSVRETPDGEPANCHERSTSEFDGQASVSGGPFDTTRARVVRGGAIERDTRGDSEPSSRATLLAAMDDGSSLALRLLSDRDATAQVDVSGDAAAVSYTIDYRFEP